jgi:uncharacterized membrane protein
MFHGYTSAHIANILFHILGGTVALAAGMLALVTRKGGRLHIRSGRAFIYAYVLIVITAILGIVVFEFRSFLAVATIASAYDVFAGYRALRLRGRRPQLPDIIASALAFSAPGIFIYAMHVLHNPWSPALTWSVLGGILALSTYDLARLWLPLRFLQRAWLHEHLYKMLAAYIAITATAGATIFPHFQPWSALILVILGETATIGFLLFTPLPRLPATKSSQNSNTETISNPTSSPV